MKGSYSSFQRLLTRIPRCLNQGLHSLALVTGPTPKYHFEHRQTGETPTGAAAEALQPMHFDPSPSPTSFARQNSKPLQATAESLNTLHPKHSKYLCTGHFPAPESKFLLQKPLLPTV